MLAAVPEVRAIEIDTPNLHYLPCEGTASQLAGIRARTRPCGVWERGRDRVYEALECTMESVLESLTGHVLEKG